MSYPLNNAILAIQQKLVSDELFTDSECFLSLESNKIEYIGGVYCAITPGNISIDQGFVMGAGLEGGLLTINVNIRLWSQNALDDASRDTLALTQNTLGLYSRLSAVIDSLQMYGYCNAQGIGSYAEPMRLLGIEKSARDSTRPEWLYIDSSWEVRIMLA